MRLASRILAFVLLVLAAFWFTVANSRELVNVNLFLFRVRASLPLVVFGSMLAGMVAVFLVGVRADLRTRRLLDRYRRALERPGASGASESTVSASVGPGRPGVPSRAGPGEAGGSETASPGRHGALEATAGETSGNDPDHEDPSPGEGRSDDRRASTPST